MAELTPEERMDRIEALLARMTEVTNKLRTFDELDAVVQEIFGEIEDLGHRIEALENNLDMVESTVSPPNG
jgi:archaellum component FlaC